MTVSDLICSQEAAAQEAKGGNMSQMELLEDSHQVGTQHEEADEVQVGQVAAAGVLLAGLNVGFRVTASPWKRPQHDLLPLLSSGTPAGRPEHPELPGLSENHLLLVESVKRGRAATNRKSTRTAMKNVWKLQFLLMLVSSSTATFPNI